MKTLMIKDLPLTEELNRKAMSAVHGGMDKSKGASLYLPSSFSLAKSDVKFDATQVLSQNQKTLVNNGNNVAFASDITATVNPYQNGTNTINFA